jgi:RNA polymerase sigma factor (sigma-70 family)
LAAVESAVTAGATTQDLYSQYSRQIYSYCLHKLRSREEAEDAVQTTFMNAFRSLQRGATTQFEQAWLFKIAQNVCFARQSSASKRLRLEAPNDFEMLQEIVPAREGEQPLELMGLEEALEQMPENQRRAILLREWQGLSYREIADELELSQAAVEMLIFRARRALAGALEEPEEARVKKVRAGRRVGALGSLLGALKTLFGGGAAIKAVSIAAAAIAVVGESANHTIVHRSALTKAAPASAVVVKASAPATSRAQSSAHVTRPVARLPRTAVAPNVAPRQRVRVHGAVVVSHAHSTMRPRTEAPVVTAAAAPAVVAPTPAPLAPTTTSVPDPSPAAGPAPVVADTAPAPAPPKKNDRETTIVAPPAVTTTPTREDHGKKAKDKDPAPPAPVLQPVAETPAPVPAPAAVVPAPQPDPGNGNGNAYGRNKDKGAHGNGQSDLPLAPVVTTADVTAPVVTTPAPTAPPAPPTSVDHGNGHGNGNGRGHSK